MAKGKFENQPDASLFYQVVSIDSPILGVNPLNKAPAPSFLIRSRKTVAPETLLSKLAFWIRVYRGKAHQHGLRAKVEQTHVGLTLMTSDDIDFRSEINKRVQSL